MHHEHNSPLLSTALKSKHPTFSLPKMNSELSNMPSHALGFSDRYSNPNLNFIAATSLATAVFLWVVIHRRRSLGSGPSTTSQPWRNSIGWRNTPTGIVQTFLYGIISTVADGPFRALDFLNSVTRRLYSGLESPHNTKHEGPPGLRNIDNSCYQNSTIQGFASLNSLRHFLEETALSLPSLSESSTTATLSRFLTRLADENNNGDRYWLPRVLKSMDSWEQQDAQEYFSKVLDDVEKDIITAFKSNPEKEAELSSNSQHLNTSPQGTPSQVNFKSNIPRLPLEGLTAQYVQCATCGFSDGLSLTPFTSITVPLESVGVFDIGSCLDEFTQPEEIGDVQCAKCTVTENLNKMRRQRDKMAQTGDSQQAALVVAFDQRIAKLESCFRENNFDDDTLSNVCKIPKSTWVSSTKFRQAVIASPPESLVLHINRSVFDETTGVMRKNHSFVEFPIDLNISQWCLSKASRRLPLSPDMFNRPYARDFIKETVGEVKKDCSFSRNCNPITSAAITNQRITSMLPRTLDEAWVYPWKYKLRALISHHGRHENGHYVCYRYQENCRRSLDTVKDDRNHCAAPPSSASDAGSDSSNMTVTREVHESKSSTASSAGKWWYISDDYVSPSSEEDVLRQGDVFMLFYERVPADPTDIPQPFLHTPTTLPSNLPIPGEANDDTIVAAPQLPDEALDSGLLQPGSKNKPRFRSSGQLSAASTVAESEADTVMVERENEDNGKIDDSPPRKIKELESLQPTTDVQLDAKSRKSNSGPGVPPLLSERNISVNERANTFLSRSSSSRSRSPGVQRCSSSDLASASSLSSPVFSSPCLSSTSLPASEIENDSKTIFFENPSTGTDATKMATDTLVPAL